MIVELASLGRQLQTLRLFLCGRPLGSPSLRVHLLGLEVQWGVCPGQSLAVSSARGRGLPASETLPAPTWEAAWQLDVGSMSRSWLPDGPAESTSPGPESSPVKQEL